MSEDNDAEKSHEPSQRRLDEARRKGDVPRSMDLASAAVYGAAVLSVMVTGAWVVDRFGSSAMGLIEQSDRISLMMTHGARPMTKELLIDFGLPLLPLFLIPMLAAILAIAAQRGFIFAPDKIAMKGDRINPLTALGQRFGREGIFNFLKGLFKLIAVCVIVAIMVPDHAQAVLATASQDAGQSSVLMMQIMMEFLILSFLVSLVFGGADYGWQWLQHRRRNMMTRQEAIEEHKDQEGDPHVKMQRRQKGREMAMSQMLAAVSGADVIVVNPTHYAVALKWKRGDRNAPVLLAKGVDEVAARIREKAIEAGVPIHRDPPTARAIYASVEVGDPIRPDQYKAVAAAIRFAETMRKRARRRG
ncbi:EscU/YscU/HrcU family type III secretion system export apparatus switch protein [Stagnihabitans tardus]|uniref:Flagellar type III secretion system protein FlhB n=1 Tax=Stagnihabitans tardus TaxID=2699202 RepID=A0AAE4Y9T3_9RHOB|nr:flagellar type III secretion system protein FlhB [Stagnihabitans tardus]NBZ87323.1 flagellar type III secretion system protein FlhB [Stagnihabitans tardus]